MLWTNWSVSSGRSNFCNNVSLKTELGTGSYFGEHLQTTTKTYRWSLWLLSIIVEVILHARSLNLSRNNHHGRNSRNGHNFGLPAHRTALFAKKPSHAGAKLFNVLPTQLKQLEENKWTLSFHLLHFYFMLYDAFSKLYVYE